MFREELRQLIEVIMTDETPMVRKSVATALPDMVRAIPCCSLP
jgi:3-methyladenine DNA glycosylase AlkD